MPPFTLRGEGGKIVRLRTFNGSEGALRPFFMGNPESWYDCMLLSQVAQTLDWWYNTIVGKWTTSGVKLAKRKG